MGRFLKQCSMDDKTQAGKIMVAVGKVLSTSAQRRLSLLNPLDRIIEELKTFRRQAIRDTDNTMKRMEQSRTEYRGTLLWMKNVSEELDPDTYKHMEKFRCVQEKVRKTKSIFDRLKLDSMQKIDLLAASRCNMLSHALIGYQDALLAFLESTSKSMVEVAESFKGYQYFEFSILKQLRSESLKLASTAESGDEASLAETDISSSESVGHAYPRSMFHRPYERLRLEQSSKLSSCSNAGANENVEDDQLIDIFGQSDCSSVEPINDRQTHDGSPGFLSNSNTASGNPDKKCQGSLEDLFAVGSMPTGSGVEADSTLDAGEFATEWANVFKSDLDQYDDDNSVFGEMQSYRSATRSDPNATTPPTSSSATADLHFFDYDLSSAGSLPDPTATSSKTDGGEQSDVLKNEVKPLPTNLDAWMNLFSDLGAIGNPDSLSKKTGQISDA